MKTSRLGINLIKKYEGCRLIAYKPIPTEEYYTIGYGHYGADVKEGQRISQVLAEVYLKADLNKFEVAVNSLELTLTQNQFDALVSFSFNCGIANLKKLVAKRTLNEIADAMLKYNKAGGKVLKGLTKRREEERKLFLNGYVETVNKPELISVAKEVVAGKWGNGSERKRKLTEAGYNYKQIQTLVNQLVANRG